MREVFSIAWLDSSLESIYGFHISTYERPPLFNLFERVM